MPIAECEVKKEFRIPHSELGNTLASGPQACFFAEKAIAKVRVGKGIYEVDRRKPKWYRF
jgi:hypothetical protein